MGVDYWYPVADWRSDYISDDESVIQPLALSKVCGEEDLGRWSTASTVADSRWSGSRWSVASCGSNEDGGWIYDPQWMSMSQPFSEWRTYNRPKSFSWGESPKQSSSSESSSSGGLICRKVTDWKMKWVVA